MAELSIEEALAAEIAEFRPAKQHKTTLQTLPKTSSARSCPKERKRKKSKKNSKRTQSEATPVLIDLEAETKIPTIKHSASTADKPTEPCPPSKQLSQTSSKTSSSIREVQVVQFVDPDALHRPSTSDEPPTSAAAAAPSDVEGGPVMHGGWVDPRQLLKDAVRDIGDLNIAHAQGKAKRKLERQKVVDLGGKPGKVAKMPLPLLQNLRKAKKAKTAKEDELLRAMGMADPKRKQKRVKKAVGGAGTRWVDRSSVTDKRMRGGVLHVKPLSSK